MNQKSPDRLTTAGNNRALLISLLEEINQTSREIKANLTRLSSEPRDDDPVGRDRQQHIRQMKDKQGHLKTERELVKHKLATLKEYHKAMNHVANNHTTQAQISYLDAFMASAIALLDEQQLDAIESMAANMIDSKAETEKR